MNNLKLECLPPTKVADNQHSLRIYLVVQVRRGNDPVSQRGDGRPPTMV